MMLYRASLRKHNYLLSMSLRRQAHSHHAAPNQQLITFFNLSEVCARICINRRNNVIIGIKHGYIAAVLSKACLCYLKKLADSSLSSIAIARAWLCGGMLRVIVAE